MSFFSWLGILLVAIIAIFFPRTILAIVTWNVLDFGVLGGLVLTILTILSVLVDLGALE